MVISVTGEYFVYETETEPTRTELEEFFRDLTENDVLEVRLISPFSKKIEKVYHVNQYFLKYNINFVCFALEFNEHVFETASKVCPYYAAVPVLDKNGNCISILKKVQSYYEHFYQYGGELDLDFLNRYSYIALFNLNEYSAELYKRVIPYWRGKEVFLVGSDWFDYIELFPKASNVRVTLSKDREEMFVRINNSYEMMDGQLLCIVEKLPENEDLSRYQKGIICYDEIMTLTFMFSYVIHPGDKHPDKKFLVIDGFFRIEGMFAIWNKVFTAARYAVAKGYYPVFQIVSSDANIYSDHEADDIWDKFFQQPGDYTLQEVHQSCYLALSPNMNLLNTMRYIMDEVSQGISLNWPRGIFNVQVEKYIAMRQKKFVPYPERTLGILLRGTDYIHNPLPNHAKHATAEMIIEKIAEVEHVWDFDWLYLATEDEKLCLKMKEQYGERISFTDQERYSVNPGQLLVDLHQKKSEGEGFRLGAEYLCSVYLLSQCGSLIASGNCGALSEAIRENNGRYQHVFVFDLGLT